MIDLLAELYVVQLAKWALFLENPTSCPWILSFQAWTLLLGSIWLVRTGVQTSRVHELTRRIDREALADPRLERAARRARRKLRRGAPWSWQRACRAWVLRRTPVQLAGTGELLLCNTGWLSSRVIVSRSAVRLLDDDELEAAVAHEYAHVLHRDNLARALLDGLAYALPPIFWYALTLRMVVGTLEEYGLALVAGLGLGAAVRFGALPLVAYAQERRSDEIAGRVVRDRLVVASALVKIGRAADAARRPLRLSPVWSPFALFHSQVSQRAKGLLLGSGRLVLAFDRWGARATRLAAVGLVVAGGLAAYRAAERELSARVTIVPGHAGVELREGAATGSGIVPAEVEPAPRLVIEQSSGSWPSWLIPQALELCIRGERCLGFGNDFDASTPGSCGLSADCLEECADFGDCLRERDSYAVAAEHE